MKLWNGITILQPAHHAAPSERIWLSGGSILAQMFEPSMTQYDPTAYIPMPVWRAPDVHEYGLLTTCTDQARPSPGTWMSVISLPDDVYHPVLPLREAAQRGDLRELRRLFSAEELQQPIRALETFASTLRIDATDHPGRGVLVAGPPGKLTTTYDRGPRYVGLHIDSFYDAPPQLRAASANRICFNLGAEDRWLLFVNVPVGDIAARMRALYPDDLAVQGSGSVLGHRFLQAFPDYPVVKVRVAPGEAYIAPTENMIHDGSTYGMRSIDVKMTILGHFGPGEAHLAC